jgi:lysophospholipase L1-like esterase
MTGVRRLVRGPVRAIAMGACLLVAALLAGCGSTDGTATANGTASGAQKTGAASSPGPAAGGHGGKAADPGSMKKGALGGRYVALGDSFTSAPLVPDQGGFPLGCLRSDEDYPSLVAAAIHPSSFSDVSCYGASTADMSHPQKALKELNPPQLNALSATDTLVTVQVGGDDIGVSQIVTTCAALSLTGPFGSPCTKHYTASGTDQLAQAVARTAPKVGAVLRAIARRAPEARILLVGYPDILPVSGHGCWPKMPIARGDMPYLRGVETRLNAMLATEAAGHGATFVNTYTGSIGHDACQRRGVKWVEGLIPTSLAVPFHPNALGEQAMARQVLAVLR